MRTVTFQSVLWGVARLLGMNPAKDLTVQFAATFTEYINRHVESGWRFDQWPEWTLTEARRYRPEFAATGPVTAGQEIYYPPADRYYQAVTAQETGKVAPAYPDTLTVTGAGDATANGTYRWDPAATTYEDTGMTPQVWRHTGNPARVLLYTDSAGGTWKILDLDDPEEPVSLYKTATGPAASDWVVDGGDGPAPTTYFSSRQYVTAQAYWAECAGSYPATEWTAARNIAVGEQLVNPADRRPYQARVGHVSGPAWDAAKFGALTPFQRYVAYAQAGQTEIWEAPNPCAFRRDPRVYPQNPWPVPSGRGPAGITLPPGAPNQVWLRFFPPPPVFTSAPRSDAAAYAAGVKLYDAATGDCWVSLAAIAPGESPTLAPAKWRRVEFPAVLASFVTRAAVSDVLRDQKQTSRAQAELAAAQAELEDEADKALGGQGIYETATVAMG